MSKSEDALLAKLALQQNLISPADLQKALLLQKKYYTETQEECALEDILEEQGSLNSENKQKLLKALKKHQRSHETIPGYRILRRLGEGGMGVVYLADDLEHPRKVAIKILPSKFSKDLESRERFLREAQAMSKLDHPNLVRGYTVFEKDKKIFFIMEYVKGVSVEAEITTAQQPYSETKALWITRQIAHALDYCHRQQIIHRDVKPENIMINEVEQAKLTDLGLAKDLNNDNNLTQAGMTVGTPNYISPEQAKGNVEVDFRCDIYSLGATLYFMLTAQTPFSGSSPLTVMNKHIKEPLVPPQKLMPQLSSPVNALVVKMMAKNPRDRYSSCQDLLDDLDRIASGDSLSEISISRLTQKNPHLSIRSSSRTAAYHSQSPLKKLKLLLKKKKTLFLFFVALTTFSLLLYTFLSYFFSPNSSLQEKEEYQKIQEYLTQSPSHYNNHLHNLDYFLTTYPSSPYREQIKSQMEEILRLQNSPPEDPAKKAPQETPQEEEEEEEEDPQEIQRKREEIQLYVQQKQFGAALYLLEETLKKVSISSSSSYDSFQNYYQQVLKLTFEHSKLEIFQALEEEQWEKAAQAYRQYEIYLSKSSFWPEFEKIGNAIENRQKPSQKILNATPLEQKDLFSALLLKEWKPFDFQGAYQGKDLQLKAFPGGATFLLESTSSKIYGGFSLDLPAKEHLEIEGEIKVLKGEFGIYLKGTQFPSAAKLFRLLPHKSYFLQILYYRGTVSVSCNQLKSIQKASLGFNPKFGFVLEQGGQISLSSLFLKSF
jgi:serine/threonine protein kinase